MSYHSFAADSTRLAFQSSSVLNGEYLLGAWAQCAPIQVSWFSECDQVAVMTANYAMVVH